MALLTSAQQRNLNKAWLRLVHFAGFIGGLPLTLGTLLGDMLVKSKYMLALIDRVHMEADASPGALTALAGGATSAACVARANALKVILIAHMSSVGTISADGMHLTEDDINADVLEAVPDATGTDLTATAVIIHALADGINAHMTQSGVHFHDDDGAALTLTEATPNTAPKCVTDLNQIRVFLNAHNVKASE